MLSEELQTQWDESNPLIYAAWREDPAWLFSTRLSDCFTIRQTREQQLLTHGKVHSVSNYWINRFIARFMFSIIGHLYFTCMEKTIILYYDYIMSMWTLYISLLKLPTISCLTTHCAPTKISKITHDICSSPALDNVIFTHSLIMAHML